MCVAVLATLAAQWVMGKGARGACGWRPLGTHTHTHDYTALGKTA